MTRYELEKQNQDKKDKMALWVVCPTVLFIIIAIPILAEIIPLILAFCIVTVCCGIYLLIWRKPLKKMEKKYPTTMSRKEMDLYEKMKDMDSSDFIKKMKEEV
jgi:hypothetical protein